MTSEGRETAMTIEKICVLIVAESSQCGRDLATRLKKEGCQVHLAASVKGGLDAARGHPFDTVIFLRREENSGEAEIVETARARNSGVEVVRVEPGNSGKTAAVVAALAKSRAAGEMPADGSRYHNLLDAVFDGVLIVDVATETIRAANMVAARSLGYTQEEIRGMSVWKCTPPGRKSDVRRIYERILKVGRSADDGFVLRRKDGEVLHCRCKAMVTGKPPVKFIEFVFCDVTEKRRLIQHLAEAAKSIPLRQVISGVVHEINNPLAAVLGYAQLSLTTTSRKKLDEYLRTIHEQAGRCQRIVEKLSSFGRGEKPQRKVTDLNRAIEEVVSLFTSELRISDIDLKLSACPSPLPVRVNRAQIQQVFVSFILAVRDAMATASTRKLAISTECSEEEAVVTLSVSGAGAGTKLHEIFASSHRPLPHRTDSALSASQSIIHANDGDIEVVLNPGQGTTFCIRFPLAMERVA